jgi:phage host-nuclease inhibitor protein Gam
MGFETAFDTVFSTSRFNADAKSEVKKEVGEIMNWWRQKKRIRESHSDKKKQALRHQAPQQKTLGINLSHYPE